MNDMGSMIEMNDTLQLTAEQGLPAVLDLKRHLESPLQAKDFSDTVFRFSKKPGARIYHAPPVRNFLVENRGGKWIYWGLAHVFDVCHNADGTTSGSFKVIYIYTPEEMKKAHDLIDRTPETRYFV